MCEIAAAVVVAQVVVVVVVTAEACSTSATTIAAFSNSRKSRVCLASGQCSGQEQGMSDERNRFLMCKFPPFCAQSHEMKENADCICSKGCRSSTSIARQACVRYCDHHLLLAATLAGTDKLTLLPSPCAMPIKGSEPERSLLPPPPRRSVVLLDEAYLCP